MDIQDLIKKFGNDDDSLKRKRDELWGQNRQVLNLASHDRRNLNTTEQAQFDQRHSDISAIELVREYLKTPESHESRGRQTETVLAGSASKSAADADLALRAWALRGHKASSSMMAAAERFGIDVSNPELEMRALSTGTTDAGGYSVQNEAIRGYDVAEKWFGPVRRTATVWVTETGQPLPVPRVDDTGNTAEIVAEGSGITTTADPVFGKVTLTPFQYVSKAVIVSNQLLQDSAIPLSGILGEKLGERMARKQNADFTTGAGTTLPFGIVTQSSLGKTASATNAVTWDEVLDLQASVDIAYANRPKAGFMMHQATANFLRKLKASGTGEYVWEMSLQGSNPGQADNDGVAGRILGYPVYLNNDMSSTLATANRLVIFGDLGSYWIQDAGGPVLKRADELRLLTNETVFVAFRRSDGALVNSQAVKYLRTS